MSLFVPSRGVVENYVTAGQSVPSAGRFLPLAQAVGTGIGAGRVAIGVVFLAAPVASVRAFGMDTATAKRVTHLARMAAVRDIAVGVGTLTALRGDEPAAGWVLAGAAADAADAVLVAAAMRTGKARGIAAAGVAVGAVAAAVAGCWAAAHLARHP